jgi:hypothetical protein
MRQPTITQPTVIQSTVTQSTVTQPTVLEPTKTFKFTVGADGKFSYDPPTDWAYKHTDRIRFQTDSGPFTIKFLPIGNIPVANFNPLGGPLTSVPDVGFFRADTTVTDALTEEDRATLIEGNVSPAFPEGFVGRYFYGIEVTKGKEVYSDNQKNGSYSC